MLYYIILYHIILYDIGPAAGPSTATSRLPPQPPYMNNSNTMINTNHNHIASNNNHTNKRNSNNNNSNTSDHHNNDTGHDITWACAPLYLQMAQSA